MNSYTISETHASICRSQGAEGPDPFRRDIHPQEYNASRRVVPDALRRGPLCGRRDVRPLEVCAHAGERG